MSEIVQIKVRHVEGISCEMGTIASSTNGMDPERAIELAKQIMAMARQAQKWDGGLVTLELWGGEIVVSAIQEDTFDANFLRECGIKPEEGIGQ